MTGVTGRISQRMAHGTRADGAPYKSISAVTSEATCFHTDVESLTIELEQTIFKAQGIKYITFVLDSGCSSTLCGTDVHSLMLGSQPSQLRIRGFNGEQRVPGVKHGSLHMYAISADRSFAGSPVEFEVDTVNGLNHHLFSMTEAFEKQGFDLHLVHSGFSGLSKIGDDGMEIRIPVHHDPDSHQWVIHMLVAEDAAAVTRAGHSAEQELWDHIDSSAYQTDACDTDSLRELQEARVKELFIDGCCIEQDRRGFPGSTELGKLRSTAKASWDALDDDCKADLFDGFVPSETATDSTHLLQPTFFSQEAAVAEIISLGGVIGVRDGDYLETIDVDTMVTAFGALADALDSFDDHSDKPVVSADELVQAIQDSEYAIGNSRASHARERKMSSLEYHKTRGHIGYHEGCDTCRSLKANLRRAYQTVEPFKEKRPGYTWSADTITWSSRSRYGCKYTTVFRDHCSGYMRLIHSWLRSDLTGQIEKLVLELRADPLISAGKDYHIMTMLHLDPAGEWRDDNKEFMAMCKRIGLLPQWSSPDRKESLKERAVQEVERGTKAIMAGQNLPIEWWQDAADQFVQLASLFPLGRDIVSADGDAKRPKEVITDGRYSRAQCDRDLHYFVQVGTPAMVTDQNQKKASNVEHLDRTRWAIVVRMTCRYGWTLIRVLRSARGHTRRLH